MLHQILICKTKVEMIDIADNKINQAALNMRQADLCGDIVGVYFWANKLHILAHWRSKLIGTIQ